MFFLFHDNPHCGDVVEWIESHAVGDADAVLMVSLHVERVGC